MMWPPAALFAADGVSQCIEDYAFYRGHWYSYFGVVSRVVVVPAVSGGHIVVRRWRAGDDTLRCGRALLMPVFLVFRMSAGDSCDIEFVRMRQLAAVSMLCVFMLLAFNGLYLVSDEFLFGVPIATCF